MKKILSCSLLILLSLYTLTFAQADITKQKPFKTSIFIHTSKPQYLSGEKIWLSAYLFNASTEQLLEHKHPLYIQLYAADGKMIAHETLYTEEGRGSGAVALLPSTPPGIYRLQAFTQSMAMAKQPNYEQRIYVGTEVIDKERNTEIKTSDLLKIVADSGRYTKRSPVKLLLKADTTLGATLSISVYKETASPVNRLIVHSKISTQNPPETAEELLYMGRAMRAKGSAIINGQVILMLGQQTYMANTDSVGFFIFTHLDLQGEQTAYWQVNNAKGKIIADATIQWVKFPSIPLKIDSLKTIKETIQVMQQPAVFLSDGDSLEVDSKMLEEVAIRTKKLEPPLLGLPVLHKENDVSYAVNFENNQLLNSSAGGEHNFYKMLKFLPACFLADKPKYLLDGVMLENPEEVLDLRQIKRIELLRGTNGWVYGSTCVYAIYTFGVEKYTKKEISKPVKTLKLQGYQPSQAFYSPNYEGKNSTESDNRQTLYWHPALTVQPKQSEVSLRFFASDERGTYKVVVQGMSNAGAVYTETSFLVD